MKIRNVTMRGLAATAMVTVLTPLAMAGQPTDGGPYQDTVSVPEPSTLYLFGLALAGIAIVRKLRK